MKINSSLINTKINNIQSDSQSKNTKSEFKKLLNTEIEKDNKKELYKACQDLESVFVNKMFDSMRATIPRTDLMGNSFGLDVFESMLYEEYSKKISKQGSIGIADILYKQLSGKI
ncbi:hypothetical protein SYNTR_1110 [Candidatus Syntrophocurvum alkaliphilum]|uniref:Flagellar protein FlgJ N-terminal domain-containing protein n=1 Tax=Candidatus Syntrophocurvum alkaliphilum TaxID=2293317 RepID=A0A6I6DHE2_9FIRM|nr:rod-binding protein [Candidatus Syntrophocurvum alkaliphilum]QGT99703.1 hypothetical protein SYNTR_1110 [Candidatus Syntrophocurvum alkaliphilum]